MYNVDSCRCYNHISPYDFFTVFLIKQVHLWLALEILSET